MKALSDEAVDSLLKNMVIDEAVANDEDEPEEMEDEAHADSLDRLSAEAKRALLTRLLQKRREAISRRGPSRGKCRRSEGEATLDASIDPEGSCLRTTADEPRHVLL